MLLNFYSHHNRCYHPLTFKKVEIMAESLNLPSSQNGTAVNREEIYRAIVPQVASIVSDEDDQIANMANVAAVLREALGFFWIGFYRNENGELVLGPFQGTLACTRIPYGKGVCGAALERKETILVPDVEAFPGHIACSSLSKSEIVVPGVKEGEVLFVLDIDSDKLDDFTKTDQRHLEKVVDLLL